MVLPHVSSNGRFESTRDHVRKRNGDAKSSPLAVSDSVGSVDDDDGDDDDDDDDGVGSRWRVRVPETRVPPSRARPSAPDDDEAAKKRVPPAASLRIHIDAELVADVAAGARDVAARRAKASTRPDDAPRRARRRATADMGRPGVTPRDSWRRRETTRKDSRFGV